MIQRIFPILLSGIVLLLPSVVLGAVEALVPCDGPECQTCHAITLVQRVLNFLITISAFLAVALFAWAGFLMLTAAGDSGQVTRAKGMFVNVIAGLVIILAGWLIVDTVMKYLYNEGGYGPWNEIKCVSLPESTGVTPPTSGGSTGTGTQNQTPSGNGTCAPITSGPCSVEALQGTFGSAAGQASQICNVESRGIPTATPRPCNSNLCDVLPRSDNLPFSFGLFQMNITANYLQCNGQRLNCPAAFSGRNRDAVIINRPLYDQCAALAKDVSCNLQNAQRLYNQRNNWGPWRNSADKCSLPR